MALADFYYSAEFTDQILLLHNQNASYNIDHVNVGESVAREGGVVGVPRGLRGGERDGEQAAGADRLREPPHLRLGRSGKGQSGKWITG